MDARVFVSGIGDNVLDGWNDGRQVFIQEVTVQK